MNSKNIFIFSLSIISILPLLGDDRIYKELSGYKNVRIKKIEKDHIRIMHDGGFANITIADLTDEIKKELNIKEEIKNNDVSIKKNDINDALVLMRSPDPKFKFLRGKIIQVLSNTSVLVMEEGSNQDISHVNTFTEKLFEGDNFNEAVKPSGAFQYSTVLGATKKVRSYVSIGSGREIPTSPHCFAAEEKIKNILNCIEGEVITAEHKEQIGPILNYATNQLQTRKNQGLFTDKKVGKIITLLQSL
jgi:hypothetical protein